ncbi:hypothetical protein BB560_006687 [Smittium megazygosporum]|uniref:Cytochrome P450 n=1 Tax=Smittium megazygosporum TaxID=133381 RepID=A0A2T9Y2N8_9FUNG|nr:hypothetical protein BB560_006687 [Smittium megazygosporum]
MINYETTEDVTSNDYIVAMKKAEDIAATDKSRVDYTVGSSHIHMFMSTPSCLLNSSKYKFMIHPPSRYIDVSRKIYFYTKKLTNLYNSKLDDESVKSDANWIREFLESIMQQQTIYYGNNLVYAPLTYSDYNNDLISKFRVYWDIRSKRKYLTYLNKFILKQISLEPREGFIKVMAEEGVFAGVPKEDVGTGLIFPIAMSGRVMAPVLSNFIIDLTIYPHVFLKLALEQKIIIKKYGNEITLSALNEMVYLDACISESIRLGTMSGLPRLVEKDMYLPNGAKLKASSSIKFGRFTHNRSESYFSHNPHDYIPERHFKTHTKLSDHSVYSTQWGFGQQMCPGVNYSCINMKLISSILIRKYNISKGPEQNERRHQGYELGHWLFHVNSSVYFEPHNILNYSE